MKMLYKLLAFCALCCLFLSPAQAQFVANPHFHILHPLSSLTNCTTANVTVATVSNRLQDMCSVWFTPTYGTPDYFYGCDKPHTTADYGVPYNRYFFPDSCEDDFYFNSSSEEVRAYAGIDIIDNPTSSDCNREYITQQLSIPLQPGQTYTISFMYRPSNLDTMYLVQRLGCLLTTTAPTASDTYDNNNGALDTTIGQYAEIYKDSGLDTSSGDAFGWHYVSVQIFISDSTKHYLTIGNFQEDIPDAEWMARPGQPIPPVPPGGGHAYYVIDNVHICKTCPPGITTKKIISDDPDKCCYEISVLSDSTYCGALTRFTIEDFETGTIVYDYQGNTTGTFTICLDRFTSGQMHLKLYNETGQVCSWVRDFECDCECSETQNPPGFSVSLQPQGSGSTECCWNVVVNNNYYDFPYPDGCDVHLLGIALQAPATAILTPASGYSQMTTLRGTSYITKNNTPGGDLYQSSTATIIATLCLPQGTLDSNIVFRMLKAASPSLKTADTFCGAPISQKLMCADKCCDQILDAVLVQTAEPDYPGMQCCFRVDISLPPDHPCIQTVTVQTYAGGNWVVSGAPMPIGPSATTATVTNLCTAAGTTKHIRLLFKDNDFNVVCVREFTLKCEAECCSQVLNLNSHRETTQPCCYHIQGSLSGVGPCPSIADFVVQQYSGTSWVPIASGTPTGYTFSVIACVTSSYGTIRIQFRDGFGNVVCTRWLHVLCPGTAYPKAGTEGNPGSLEREVYAVPNPAVDATTIHYVLREESDVSISLYNSIGELMVELQSVQVSAGPQTAQLSTERLPAGVYFVQINVGNGMITIPITIVR